MVDGPPVSSTRKYLPHCAGLPDTILLGRNEPLVEVASDLPQREPVGPVLSHHSDHRLLGAVLHQPVIQVVEAEGHVASPLAPVPVLWDAEPVKGFQHPRPAGAGQARDLPGGQVFVRVESIERVLASQSQYGRQKDDPLYLRGDCSARVRSLSVRGSRIGQAASRLGAAFFISWAIRWIMSKGGLKAGTTWSSLSIAPHMVKRSRLGCRWPRPRS